MIKNYLKIAWRNIFREKKFAIINIISLTVGIASVLFLLLLVQYAYNFDDFHKNADRIYRLNNRLITKSGSEINTALTPWPWAEALANEYPEIEEYVRFDGRGHRIAIENDVFSYWVTYVDESFFDVFSFRLKKGDPAIALNAPKKVVLSHHAAINLFGRENPLGKVIRIDGERFEVTGVLEEIPANSSMSFNMLVSSVNLTPTNFPNIDSWKTHSNYTYLLLQEGADKSEIEKHFTAFLQKYIDEDAASRYSPWLQPLTAIFLSPDLYGSNTAHLDESYIYIFSAIGFLILLISCINFINISTARAAKRNVEIGIRKVAGAGKRQLIFQYLFEVFLLSLAAVAVSVILVEWAVPWFNSMTFWAVEINYFENTFFLLSAILVVLFVTLVAGGYPAFHLTRFNPAQVFRKRGAASRRSWLRSGLVISQFVLAIFLLFCSKVLNNQIQYLYNKDLGYNDENVMQVNMSGKESYQEARSFRRELLRNPDIQSVSLASNGPLSGGYTVQYKLKKTEKTDGIKINTYYVDDQFIPLLNLKLITGRNFNSNIASDSLSAFIINEAAAQKFGWNPKNSVEKTIIRLKSDESDLQGRVIGVLKNFNFQSLEVQIRPLILRFRPRHFDTILIKVQKTADLSEINSFIESQWKAFFPGQWYYSYFIENARSDNYRTEEIIAEMLSLFTWVAIFIACLGLLGLASYETLQRTKEIGIRKVMGATVTQIVSMLALDFLRFVAIALVIGLPLAYWAINEWLQKFVYHVDVGISTVAFTLLVTFIVALATVSWQSIRAALANPVDSLRSE